ncbi:uncharacterized protein LOC135484145 isoform X2 [Lineus longissimus]|uniref:uncharacterized protein LOC135484145 isoform X2 n=1 Tax=Lineus longissimus TaxID=88925 RepID=UPI00315DD914
MGSVEAQLAEYRAKKASERSSNHSSGGLGLGSFNILRRISQNNQKVKKEEVQVEEHHQHDENSPRTQHYTVDGKTGDTAESHVDSNLERKQQHKEYKPSWFVTFVAGNYYLSRIATYPYTSLILKVILWLVLWCLFIELEFGAVYFVTSLLYVIYASLRTGPRNGPSAYSVFNENFETLEGTFTAEEFDSQMRRGGGMM